MALAAPLHTDVRTGAFSAPYAEPDEAIVARLLPQARATPEAEARIDGMAGSLIGAIRAGHGSLGGLEDFLRAYSLSTEEGLALMGLAEALLRVPDAETADRLIEDKLAHLGSAGRADREEPFLVSASAWALGVSARLIRPGVTPETLVAGLMRRLGLPAVRAATRQAMRLLGHHFVLGETIEQALQRAGSASGRAWRYSFDMLGEGARTAADARAYFEAYARAIEAIGRAAGEAPLPERPGISVKLSALHPRYEAVSRDRVLDEVAPQLLDLARAARRHELNFTVDAEEADRLELSLELIERTLADPSLRGWGGFGLAIQAYQKRALAVVAWITDLATALDRRLMVRLVKGAYWDTEIKQAQVRGLDDYPVFTRKAVTDLSYAACANALLAARPRLYPQFATHNALTVATVLEAAPEVASYEFQRLHGMGEALYEALRRERPEVACRVYAPVGGHRDLLAYLVRRLLENGANSSFISEAADPNVPVARLLRRPADRIGTIARARHAHIPRPPELYGPTRRNSAGVEFGDRASLLSLLREAEGATLPSRTLPLVDGREVERPLRPRMSPIDGAMPLGSVGEADAELAQQAIATALEGFPAWQGLPVSERAAALDRAADLLEHERGPFLRLMQIEGGKTLDDALAELREAVDFCRYYAAQAREKLAVPARLPGPTGEENRLLHRGRGVFVCISPWNFPLAIFMGQVAAALVAGNTVVAKPAGQTPVTASLAVRLLHRAGIPGSALQFVPGDGGMGAALVADPRVAGVAFTGSTATGWAINRALAAKDGPIVPLIAETGGVNAMIVDATALPEQVTDDVVTSAFRSAGQRCSALRLLCLQADVAPRMLEMITGAARELVVGDPLDPATHIGPVIDAEAKARLDAHITAHKSAGRVVFGGEGRGTPPSGGTYVRPHVIGLDRPEKLGQEIFGPVLHVVTWHAGELDRLVAAIASSGYGLTLGIHSRVESMAAAVAQRLPTGNVYINRSMIGAVVGTQPFGGFGLSGTGPKAGGPNYLQRFTTEQVVSINTAAAGGNATLLATDED